MKTNQTVRIIIPLILLLGTATAFIVAVIGNQQINTSTEELQESNTVAGGFVMYLHVDDINGEAIEENHEDWIDVLAYSHNVRIPDLTDPTRSVGVRQHTPLRVTKMVDRASPKLYQFCVDGNSIASVKLEFCMTNEGHSVFYKIELQNARIVSVQDYGMSSEDIPTETVSFVYERIKWVYTQYDSQGKALGNVETNWITWGESAS
ncbi:MAG: Hcp family type VI secretion system effector [Promethearchaeota archaeon]